MRGLCVYLFYQSLFDTCIINWLSGASETWLCLKWELIHKNVFGNFLLQVSSFLHAALQFYKAIPDLLCSLVQWVGFACARSSKHLDSTQKKTIPLGCSQRKWRGWSRLCFNLQCISWEVVKIHLCFGLWGKNSVCGAHRVLPALQGCSEEGLGSELLNYALWCWCSLDWWQHQAPYWDIQVHLLNARGRGGVAYDFLGKICGYTPVFMADVKGIKAATLLLLSDGTDVVAPIWLGTKGLLCSSQTQPLPHRFGLFCQTIYPLVPCCISFVGKKCFSPRNGSNNDGVEDNFNDTVLAWCMVSGKNIQARIQTILGPEISSLADFQLMEDWGEWSTEFLDLHWISCHYGLILAPSVGSRAGGGQYYGMRILHFVQLFGTFPIHANHPLASNSKVLHRWVFLWVNRWVGTK